MSRERVLNELVPRLIELAHLARDGDLQFTVDAEEADRLELSLEVIAAVLGDASLAGWDGFGLAVQAYQKRALEVIDWVEDAAAASRRRLTMRLVKGAYWDTEIKRAQERGLADYPVFTRKAMTDLCYMACVEKLLAARDRLYPQFATHNALTVASVIEDAGGVEGFEFQRLHGMGEALYDALLAELPEAACRVYAPVGGHRDLLAYLVRRLLENGANSSFVSVAADPSVPVAEHSAPAAELDRRPAGGAQQQNLVAARHLSPRAARRRGVEFGDRASLDALIDEVRVGVRSSNSATPLVDGIALPGRERAVISPIDGQAIGAVREADDAIVIAAMAAAAAGFPAWSATPVDERAAELERAADLIEVDRGRLIALLAKRGRQDARRCACRGARGGRLSAATTPPRRGRAVRRSRCRARPARATSCVIAAAASSSASARGISRWRSSSARSTAALVAGNTVVAKPAEQTPLIAARAVALLHEAGVPAERAATRARRRRRSARRWWPIRASPVSPSPARPRSAAPSTARSPRKDGPIVPLIAETGGINAMIVDATALPEQVTDDVVTSAFRSAGQRCSALRLLCLQEDVADAHARDDRSAPRASCGRRPARAGDRRRPGDRRRGEAQARRADRRAASAPARALPCRRDTALPCRAAPVSRPTSSSSTAPRDLKDEVFGPVLHVVRWRADELDALLDDIAGDRLRPDPRHPHPHRRAARRASSRGSRSATSTSIAT